MPCRVDPTPAEIEAGRQAALNRELAKVVEPLQERNDKLTHENDQLREALLTVIAYEPKAETWIGKDVAKKIQQDQVEHRKEDLSRLAKTFNEKLAALYRGKNFQIDNQGWRDRRDSLFNFIQLVEKANPEHPLEPQLGFDPDSY